jgi:hypothetical protein
MVWAERGLGICGGFLAERSGRLFIRAMERLGVAFDDGEREGSNWRPTIFFCFFIYYIRFLSIASKIIFLERKKKGNRHRQSAIENGATDLFCSF